MNRKNLLIGSLSVAVFSAVFMFVPLGFKKSGTYKPQDLNVLKAQSANDAQAWLNARYVDIATGQRISPELLNELMDAEVDRKRSVLKFTEMGPDNIGGRTRAIVVDRENPAKMWAGGVSGGVFYSLDGGSQWSHDDAFPGVPYISSMTQTPDGTVFVATGSVNENWTGNGLYYKEKNDNTWKLVPNTSSLVKITEVVSSDVNNTVFFGTSTGLKKWTKNDADITDVSAGGGACNALQISKDGQVIIGAFGSSGITYVSNDGGASFSDVSESSTANGNKVPFGGGALRIEYSISHSKNASNNYTLYAVRTDKNLKGMHVSTDNGNTWSKFIGAAGTGGTLDIYRDQGDYNSIVTVDPKDTKRIIIGGIDLWEWKQTVDNPPAGGFEQISQWFLHPTNNLYVHADNHELKWDKNNKLYVGNDGGISISEDGGRTFYPANRGYNVTQFYGIAMDKHGAVMGGTQDNGTVYNDFSNMSYKEFSEVLGGDGFECEISFFNPNVMFASTYYNSINRSANKGQIFSSFEPPFEASYGPTGISSAAHPFHTEFMLFENYDNNSEDVVRFLPTKNYKTGDVISIPSMSTGNTISYTTTRDLYFDATVNADLSLTKTDNKVINSITGSSYDLGQSTYTTIYDAAPTGLSLNDTLMVGTSKVHVSQIIPYTHYFAKHQPTGKILNLKEEKVAYNIPWDTLDVVDPYQSWFIVYTKANGGEIWGTRDALRFSASEIKWVKIKSGIGVNQNGSNSHQSVDVEFSRDLNHCYVTCGSDVYRIDGLGSVYSQSSTFESDVQALGNAAKNLTLNIPNRTFEGIAVNPNNANDLLLLQGFNGNIYRSSDATSASPNFTELTDIAVNGTSIAAYDAIIDRNNSQILVVGTALGVKVSTNGGISWDDASAGFENVPVYEVRQNWRTWAEGCSRSGEIYLGTYGRGLWVSSELVGLDEQAGGKFKGINTNLKMYPNPTNKVSTLSFNLTKSSNVSIKVYNLAGVLVDSKNLKNVEQGLNTIDIDASDFKSGTYIVKFSSNNYEETVKFIKM